MLTWVGGRGVKASLQSREWTGEQSPASGQEAWADGVRHPEGGQVWWASSLALDVVLHH